MKRLSVTFVNAWCAYVSGYGSRDLITAHTGRPPVWSSIGRGWVVTSRTARDVIAVAERQGYDVITTEDDPLPAARGVLF